MSTAVAVFAGLVVGLLGQTASAQLDVDPSDLYLKAYLIMREAEKLEKSGQYRYSYEKYIEATEIFDDVAHRYTSWSPNMVNIRRKKIRETITNLKGEALREHGIDVTQPFSEPASAVIPPAASYPSMTGPGTHPSPPPGLPSGGSPAARPSADDPLPLPTYQRPPRALPSHRNTPNVSAKIPSSRPSSLSGSSISSATGHIEVKFQELRSRITELDTEKQHLTLRLETREEQLKKTRSELQDAQSQNETLEKQLVEAQSRLEKKAPDAADIESLQTEIATLTAQLKIAKVNLDEASRQMTELGRELKGARTEVDLLKEERSQLIGERQQMVALLGEIESDSPVNVARLLALNTSLREQLETARKAAESLAGERTRDREQIAALKAEVASVKSELDQVRDENDSYRVQIAKLTDELQSTSRDLASNGSNNAVTAAALEENRMLRDIILRQLRQQARRQQAKELVLAELTKLEIKSSNLLNHIDDLAGSRMVLSDKERALFRDSYVAQLLADADLHGTLIASNAEQDADRPSEANPASVPADTDRRGEIARLASEASARFASGGFAEAEELYEEIVKLDRQNVYNLCNLGIIKARLGKPAAAEVLFSKALAYDPKHGPSRFMLGVTYFNDQKYDDALESINHSVQIDPGNARAHQYLGLIASHKGWVKRAEDEFKKAIAIDPRFAEAHFNLSILYLSSEDTPRELAQKHYQEALNHGAKPDPVMEERLKDQPGRSSPAPPSLPEGEVSPPPASAGTEKEVAHR